MWFEFDIKGEFVFQISGPQGKKQNSPQTPWCDPERKSALLKEKKVLE